MEHPATDKRHDNGLDVKRDQCCPITQCELDCTTSLCLDLMECSLDRAVFATTGFVAGSCDGSGLLLLCWLVGSPIFGIPGDLELPVSFPMFCSGINSDTINDMVSRVYT
ncbi:hypothetical protein WICPIJ_003928 [Wickerhamomyces pijperi]|uniref:Uncharacterized protein n=1 Tax=Wickerhamomyces pijperi TaxID=599730 RepID=A0A9P8Q6N7_WICPI|nr:hypothetical protein WICPIJ_003928 [Wickerhamomyces pijperi]